MPLPLPVGTFDKSKLNVGVLYVPVAFAAFVRLPSVNCPLLDPKLKTLELVVAIARLAISKDKVGS